MAEPLEGEIRGEELGKVSPEDLLKKYRRISPRPVPRVVPSVGQMFPTEFKNIMEKLKLGKEDPISKDMLGTAQEQVKLLRDLRMIGSIIQRSMAVAGAGAVTPGGGKVPGGAPGGIPGKLPLGKDLFKGGFPNIGNMATIVSLVGKFSVLTGVITATIGSMISITKAAKGVKDQFVEMSPSIAAIAAQATLMEDLRKMRMGEEIAPQQKIFEEQWIKMRDSWETPLNELNKTLLMLGIKFAKATEGWGMIFDAMLDENVDLVFATKENLKKHEEMLELTRDKSKVDPSHLRADLENIMRGHWLDRKKMLDNNLKKLHEIG